eukprot:298161_1
MPLSASTSLPTPPALKTGTALSALRSSPPAISRILGICVQSPVLLGAPLILLSWSSLEAPYHDTKEIHHVAFTYLIAFVPGWVAAQLFAAAGLPVLSAMFHFLSLLVGTRSLWTWANLGRKLKDHKGWLYRCTHEWRKAATWVGLISIFRQAALSLTGNTALLLPCSTTIPPWLCRRLGTDEYGIKILSMAAGFISVLLWISYYFVVFWPSRTVYREYIPLKRRLIQFLHDSREDGDEDMRYVPWLEDSTEREDRWQRKIDTIKDPEEKLCTYALASAMTRSKAQSLSQRVEVGHKKRRWWLSRLILGPRRVTRTPLASEIWGNGLLDQQWMMLEEDSIPGFSESFLLRFFGGTVGATANVPGTHLVSAHEQMLEGIKLFGRGGVNPGDTLGEEWSLKGIKAFAARAGSGFLPPGHEEELEREIHDLESSGLLDSGTEIEQRVSAFMSNRKMELDAINSILIKRGLKVINIDEYCITRLKVIAHFKYGLSLPALYPTQDAKGSAEEMREFLVFSIATSIWEDDLDSGNDEKTTVEDGYVDDKPEPVDDYTAVYRQNTAVYDPNKDDDNTLFGTSKEL